MAQKVVMAMVDKIGKDSDTTKEMLNSLQMSNKGLYGKVTKSRKKSNKTSKPSKRIGSPGDGRSRRSSAGADTFKG